MTRSLLTSEAIQSMFTQDEDYVCVSLSFSFFLSFLLYVTQYVLVVVLRRASIHGYHTYDKATNDADTSSGKTAACMNAWLLASSA